MVVRRRRGCCGAWLRTLFRGGEHCAELRPRIGRCWAGVPRAAGRQLSRAPRGRTGAGAAARGEGLSPGNLPHSYLISRAIRQVSSSGSVDPRPCRIAEIICSGSPARLAANVSVRRPSSSGRSRRSTRPSL